MIRCCRRWVPARDPEDADRIEPGRHHGADGEQNGRQQHHPCQPDFHRHLGAVAMRVRDEFHQRRAAIHATTTSGMSARIMRLAMVATSRFARSASPWPGARTRPEREPSRPRPPPQLEDGVGDPEGGIEGVVAAAVYAEFGDEYRRTANRAASTAPLRRPRPLPQERSPGRRDGPTTSPKDRT